MKASFPWCLHPLWPLYTVLQDSLTLEKDLVGDGPFTHESLSFPSSDSFLTIDLFLLQISNCVTSACLLKGDTWFRMLNLVQAVGSVLAVP